MRKLNHDQINEILALYPNTSAKDLADKFGVKIYTVYNHAFAHGIKKDPEWVRQNARENFHADHPAKKYWIKKGATPANKGKKIEEYMTLEQVKRVAENQYRKGHMPHNHVEVGTEVVMPPDGYVKVKIEEPNVWELKHRLVWIQYNGPIPAGANIQFRNGNRQDCTIENLYLISRRDQLKTQNSMYSRYPEEVIKNIHALGKLSRTINKSKQHD